MREGGLEPPCLAAPDPKSGVSANFTTPAHGAGRNTLKRLSTPWASRPGGCPQLAEGEFIACTGAK